MSNENVKNNAALIWNIAESLRGPYKPSEYGSVILPLVSLFRLDALLNPNRENAIKTYETYASKGYDEDTIKDFIGDETGQRWVYNTYPKPLASLLAEEQHNLRQNLGKYIDSFDPRMRDIFEDKFKMHGVIERLHKAGLLYEVLRKLSLTPLGPDDVSNIEMGALFEEILRRFNEQSNETAGEHYTPRDVLRLVSKLVFIGDKGLKEKGAVRSIYDPTCGTGGFLSMAEKVIHEINPDVKVHLYGQEINAQSYGICVLDMMMSGHDPGNIRHGNTLIDDQLAGHYFYHNLSNPPYGVDWKTFQTEVRREAEREKSRYSIALPRVSDGQLLFVQHSIAKTLDKGRLGIVLNGSPLFTGGAGSGESEIRRWILENDYLDALVALPTDMFYNTGIQTYVWVLDKNKPSNRRDKVLLIDASGEAFSSPLRKALGSKRREISEEGEERLLGLYTKWMDGPERFENDEHAKSFDRTEFGYREIRVERPLRLSFSLNTDKISEIRNLAVVSKLTGDQISELVEKLNAETVEGEMSHALLLDALSRVWKGVTGKNLTAAARKALVEHFGERDEDAEPVLDDDGKPVPDPELRDTEMVPLGVDVVDYLAEEVLPWAGDAWVDEGVRDEKDGKTGKVGYEINFNRYFYTPPSQKPLREINADIFSLMNEINSMVKS